MSNCSFNLHRQLQYLGGVWCFCICIIIVLVRIHNSCPLISNMWPKYSLSSSLSRPLCTSARRHYALKNCSLFFFFFFWGDWTSLLTQSLWTEQKKGRSGSPLLPWGTVLNKPLIQDWTVSLCNIKNHEISVFLFFFRELLPPTWRTLLTPGCCCITASVLLKWFLSSRVTIHWLSNEIFCSVVYCMQFYRWTDWVCTCLMFSGVLARGVLCPDVWMWCERVRLLISQILCVFLSLFLFLFFFFLPRW